MGLKKGQTNNANGRPKGTPNRTTTEMKTWLSGLIDKNRRQIEKDLKKLEPHQRVAIFEKLLAYITPKMQATTAQLTDEQIDMIINELTSNTDE